MAYEVTATRRRPQNLKQLVGQEFVVSTIENSIEKGQVAHAYLFSGPRGTGKTSSARILAKSLNCQEGPTSEPCGVCSNCQEVTRGNSLDVIEIDGASNTGVNDIREIKDEVLFPPTNSRYKVYIIDEVHMLSNSAFNALLKTIEEPPPYIIFIFATTEIHKVPATIRSRCQQFNFRLFSLDIVKVQLAAACDELSIKYDDDALLWIAKEGTGSMRDSYTLFDQVVSFSDGHITIEKIQQKLGLVGLDRINELASLISVGEIGPVIECTDRIISAGVSIEQFLVELAEYFRNILLIKSGILKESILGSTPESFDQEVVIAFTEDQLVQGAGQVFQLYKDIRYSLNQRFELELLLSRLARLKSFFTADDILGQIKHLKSQLTSGTISVEAPLEGEKKKSPSNLEPVEQEEAEPPKEAPVSPSETGDPANAFFNMFGKSGAPIISSENTNQDRVNPPLSDLDGTTPCDLQHQENGPSPEEEHTFSDSLDRSIPTIQEERELHSLQQESPNPTVDFAADVKVETKDGTGLDWWESLLGEMKSHGKVVLMASMSKGTHLLEGNDMTLSFPSEYIAESIEREKKYIVGLITQVMDRPISLNILIKKPKAKVVEKKHDEKIDLYLRVFRGTIIKEKSGVNK